MSRNDTLLYTGASSASFTTPRAAQFAKAKEEASKEREHTRQRLAPEEVELYKLIDSAKATEIEKLTKMVVSLDAKEERVIAELRAVQKNIKFIDDLKIAIGNLMRGRS